MSRIGKQPVVIPKGVEVKVDGQTVTVKGPKGTLSRTISPVVSVALDNGTIVCTTPGQTRQQKALWGLSRVLIANMVEGVEKGYRRELEIVGVGYKAEAKGKDLLVSAGLSHTVTWKAEPGITLTADGPTKIIVEGCDKEAVGRVASELRKIRPPEPYKGKGIRYAGEQILRKAGKTAGK